jgi:sec-independent protein translocase protein TatA
LLSIPDMALLGAAALLLFGPEQLPKVLRKVGQFTREVQNTSQSFIREMERAADHEPVTSTNGDQAHPYDPLPYDAYPGETHVEPGASYDTARPSVEHPDPPEPEPERPVAEKLAEPRAAPEPWDQPTQAMTAVDLSHPAKTLPEDDHPVHI